MPSYDRIGKALPSQHPPAFQEVKPPTRDHTGKFIALDRKKSGK